MSTKYRPLFTCFLISISSLLFSQSVNINTAKEIAKNHLLSVDRNTLKSASPSQAKIQFSALSVTSENKDTLYFVLNDTINHSFVIVAADKRSRPIIGYSLEGNYDVNNQPPAFVAWMENRKQEIESIKLNNLQPDSATVASWQNLSLKSSANETTAVEPFLKTKWGQGCYYNEMCPSDARSGYCGHDPTGCVATAMAQIMKYWNYPTKGKGSNSYTYAEYGIISADFGATTYQWDQMLNSVTSQNDAVATLMYHCGVATYMGYGPFESGTNLLPYVLVDFFDYSSNVKLINSKDYTTKEWADLLKSELDLGHPIYYTTELPSGAWHALVCDGYQGVDFFHFNWGWDGASDGYYYMKSLNPNSQIFHNNPQRAIIKIIPSHLPDGYKGVILSTNALFLNTKEGVSNPIPVTVASSSNWTAASNQSWLSLSTGSGAAGTSILNLSATENTTNVDRIATMTITADGFPPQSITIKQFHRYEVTAGGLHNLIGNDLVTITNLTLKGVIDARDFKTMRDQMPALESVDLSEATIVAYTGDQGTRMNSNVYPANTIPRNAFAFGKNGESSRLTSFISPVSTTSIGYAAFNACMSLTNLLFPSSLQSIGDDVFNNCISLRNIFIPASVFTIGNQIYYNGTSINVDAANPNYLSLDGVLYNKAKTVLIYCQNTKKGVFNIPETVTSIGYSAFFNCLQITLFTIPLSINTIGTWAFNGCNALTSIYIPSSVNVIEDAPFFGCTGLTSITVGNPTPVDLKNSNDVFLTVDKEKCTLNVPYKTAVLYRTAYQWGDFKNIIEAPNGFSLEATEVKLTSAADTATVFIKSNVAWSAKSNDAWLTVSLASGTGDNTLTLIVQGKTSEGPRTARVAVSSEGFETQIITVMQDGAAIKVTAGNLAARFTAEELITMTSLKLAGTIDARDFKTMRDLMPRLTSIDLSGVDIIAYRGVEGTSIRDITYYPANEIPEFAFVFDYSWGKNTIKSFIFPTSTLSIGYYAFCNCSGLTSLSLPASTKSIGSMGFAACKNLTSIFISTSLTTICEQAFKGCPSLINVDSTNINFSSIEGVLYNKTKTTLIRCPPSKIGSFIIPTTVKVIGQNAFYGCSNVTSITIPPSVIEIQDLAFGSCAGLSVMTVGMLVPVDLSFSDIVPWDITLYVPYGTMVRYRAADKWKDFKNIIEMPGFILSTSKAKVAAAANSTVKVTLKSNVTCVATSDQTWLTVAPIMGIGNQTLTFTAQENTSFIQRTAMVTVSGKDITPQTITVTQDARLNTGIDQITINPEFKVSPNPTTGKIKVVFDLIPQNGTELIVTDITGKIVLKQIIQEKEEWIDLTGSTPGVYLLKTNIKNMKVQKIILK